MARITSGALTVKEIQGNIVKMPEFKTSKNGNTYATLRIVSVKRRFNSQSGQWEDDPASKRFIQVNVFGNKGVEAARNAALKNGSPVRFQNGDIQYAQDTDKLDAQGYPTEYWNLSCNNMEMVSFQKGNGQGQSAGGYQNNNYGRQPQRQQAQRPAQTPAANNYAEDDDVPF